MVKMGSTGVVYLAAYSLSLLMSFGELEKSLLPKTQEVQSDVKLVSAVFAYHIW